MSSYQRNPRLEMYFFFKILYAMNLSMKIGLRMYYNIEMPSSKCPHIRENRDFLTATHSTSIRCPQEKRKKDKAPSGNGPFGALSQSYRVLAICFVLVIPPLKVSGEDKEKGTLIINPPTV
jgi:hypothetical protein